MEKYNLLNDVKTFGKQVETFPQGIKEAFDELVKMVGGFTRSFYGISKAGDDGKMLYYAVAEEKFDGEAEKYNCETFVIEKGEYSIMRLNDWETKTNLINEIFHEILSDSSINRTKPAIEWYKNKDEMFCMVKTKAED